MRYLLLIFGVLCGSTAVLMIKASTEHPALVSAGRLLIAAAVLTPLFVRDLRRRGGFGWRQVGWALLPGAFLAFHFLSWVVGARLTQVTNASLLANLTPVAMPFFLWVLYGEQVNRREAAGTLITLVGLVGLSAANLRFSPQSLPGDAICLGSMLLFAAYLALGRRNSGRVSSVWLYMVPLYWIAGLICLIAACLWLNPIKEYSSTNTLLILGLALIPTVGGHTILNYSMQHLRGQVVSVTNLLQVVFAGLQAYLYFGEQPAPAFYPAAALILTGVLVTLLGSSLRGPAKVVPSQDA